MEDGRGEKDREERGGKSKIEEEDNMEIKSERGRERGGKKQNKKANRV